MKTVFDRKLYVVGLKKIKLVGIICGIILIVCNALLPVASLASKMLNGETNQTVATVSSYAIACPLLLILVPIFFLLMFSFLNHRNESDFYHAIPFKRTCVLGSFTAAIFTWVFGILLASLLLNGLLYAIDPAVSFSPLVPVQLFAFFAVVSLYMGSFMLLAMTLTGTTVSNCTVFLILFFLVRIISTITTAMLRSLVPILDVSYSPLRFMSFRYWLPAATFRIYYDPSVFRDVGLWVYSAVVLLVLYGLSVWCFCRRKSESAGKSAVNRVLQHAFRCAFTLPLALLTVLGVMQGAGAAFAAVMVLVTLMVYYVYELITVRTFKQTLLSTPLLLVPAVCCALIVGGCYATRAVVFEQNYDADQIDSVRFYQYTDLLDLMMNPEQSSYEDVRTSDTAVSNPDANKLIAKALDESIQLVRSDEFYSYNPNYAVRYVEIQLKSGRKLGRQLMIPTSDNERIQDLLQDSPAYREAYLRLPADAEIDSLYFNGSDSKDSRELWDVFISEYEQMTNEEKLAYKDNYAYSEYNFEKTFGLTWELYFDLEGTYYSARSSHSFFGKYYIPPEFEKTRAKYVELTQSKRDETRQVLQDLADGKYDFLFDRSDKSAPRSFSYDGNGLWNGKSFLLPGGYYDNDYFGYEGADDTAAPIEDPEKAKETFRALLPYLTDEPEENGYLRIYFSLADGENSTREHMLFGLSGEIPHELDDLLTFNYSGPAETAIDSLELLRDGKLIDWNGVFETDTVFYDFRCVLGDGSTLTFLSAGTEDTTLETEESRCAAFSERMLDLLVPDTEPGAVPCQLEAAFYSSYSSDTVAIAENSGWALPELSDDVIAELESLGAVYTAADE